MSKKYESEQKLVSITYTQFMQYYTDINV